MIFVQRKGNLLPALLNAPSSPSAPVLPAAFTDAADISPRDLRRGWRRDPAKVYGMRRYAGLLQGVVLADDGDYSDMSADSFGSDPYYDDGGGGGYGGDVPVSPDGIMTPADPGTIDVYGQIMPDISPADDSQTSSDFGNLQLNDTGTLTDNSGAQIGTVNDAGQVFDNDGNQVGVVDANGNFQDLSGFNFSPATGLPGAVPGNGSQNLVPTAGGAPVGPTPKPVSKPGGTPASSGGGMPATPGGGAKPAGSPQAGAPDPLASALQKLIAQQTALLTQAEQNALKANPAATQAALARAQVATAPSASLIAGVSNTTLAIGGVAALAAILFMGSRK